MLETLIVATLACLVQVETRQGATLLRPECPVSHRGTHETIAYILKREKTDEIRVSFGRIEQYPWLSEMLARQASSSRIWDPVTGTARGESDNSYVATALRSMPEFRALFTPWSIAGISVEKVLRKPAAELPLARGVPLPPQSLLPYDAILWVTLRR